MRGIKYIIRCYNPLIEKRCNSLKVAIKNKRELQSKYGYAHIIKVPFRKRHPDFPVWFSLISLLLVEVAPEVDLCIRHILQIMQLWK